MTGNVNNILKKMVEMILSVRERKVDVLLWMDIFR